MTLFGQVSFSLFFSWETLKWAKTLNQKKYRVLEESLFLFIWPPPSLLVLFSNVIVHSSPPGLTFFYLTKCFILNNTIFLMIVVGLQSTNGSAFFKNQFLRAAGCSDGGFFFMTFFLKMVQFCVCFIEFSQLIKCRYRLFWWIYHKNKFLLPRYFSHLFFKLIFFFFNFSNWSRKLLRIWHHHLSPQYLLPWMPVIDGNFYHWMFNIHSYF